MKLKHVLAPAALVAASIAAWLVVPAAVPMQSAQTFSVAPAAASAACPGPQRLPVGDQGSSGELAADTEDRLLLAFGDGESFPVGLGTAWHAPIAGSLERVGDGDLEGFAAVTCMTAGFDEWLVGGATSIGSSARLVLSNPSDAPAEAKVTVYGPLGVVGEPVVIAVPPRGQEDRLIEGLAAELATLALRVESSGPGLVAVLQDSRLDGFQPAGTDWIGASVPRERQVIPAVGSVVEDSTVTLRLVAPEGATAAVSLVTEDGVDDWSGARNLSLEPGVVTDIAVPLEGVGALEITADAPVLAAAMTVVPRPASEGSAGDTAFDLAWTSGIDDSESATLAAVVPLEVATLSVYSPVGESVTFTDAEGATVATANVPPRTVVRIPITLAPGTLISAQGRIAWAVEIANEDGFLTTLLPVDTTRADRNVSVVPAPYAPVVPQ
jgi:hypothetical protein